MTSWPSDIQILNVLEAIAQVAKERMVEVFQHPSLSDDVPYTFGSHDWKNTLSAIIHSSGIRSRTFIFANILESKCQAGVFPLHYSYLAKGTLPYHTQQAEVIEID